MKKTIGILAMALIIGMALPALAEQTAQATGAAVNTGTDQVAGTAAAAEGPSAVAEAGSIGHAIPGAAASSSSSTSKPGQLEASTTAGASGEGPAGEIDAATSAYGAAVGKLAEAGPGETLAHGNEIAVAGSFSNAGFGSFKDISGNTYTGNMAYSDVGSNAGSSGMSSSSNKAEATT